VSAVLVIHQNFKGPATTVPIDAHGKTGPKTCTVPDDVVKGAQRDDAAAAIEAAGLVVAEQSQTSTEDAGTVLQVDPAAGEEVECGSTVTIVVATSGPEPCTVPDVVGSTRSQAAATIEDADLAVGAVSEREDASVAAGTVLQTSPTAGSELECGSTVTIVVSSGVG
jgi:serine/threonine-protein kinase